MNGEAKQGNWVPVGLVLLVALAFRLVYLWQFSNLADWEQLTVDNWYHHNWAISIAHGHVVGDTTYFRAPMYAWCLGLVYAIFGVSLWAARLFGLAIGLLSIVFTYLIARQLAGHRVGIIAAAIQSVYPVLWMFEAELLLDPLFMLVVQMCAWQMIRWSESRHLWDFFLGFLLAGLAAITRPTVLALIPLMFIFAMVIGRGTLRKKFAHAAAATLALLLTVGVVFIRNLAVAHDPVLVASQGGINFYIGNNDSADGLFAVLPEPLGHNWRLEDIAFIAERDAGRRLKPGEISSYWSGQAMVWIAHNPGRFLLLTLKRFWFSFSNVEVSNNRSTGILAQGISILKFNPICFGAIFILSVIGMSAAWRASARIRWLVAFVMAITLVNALFFVNARFRLAIVPFCIVLAAIAIVRLPELLKKRETLIAALCVGAIAGLITFSPLVGMSKGLSTQDLLSKGTMMYNHGEYSQALAYYREAESYNPSFPETNLNIGTALLRLGQLDSAASYYRREISLHPERALGYSNLAAAQLAAGQPDSAATTARKSIALRPYEPAAWMILVRAGGQTRRLDGDSLTRLCLTAAAATRDNIDVCLEAGTVLDLAGLSSAAIALYTRTAKAPSRPLETDDRMFSQSYWSAVAKECSQRAKAEMSMGALYGKRGELAQSAIHSTQAIALDSTLSGAWVNLISAEVNLGQLDAARSLLGKARAKFPQDPIVQSLVTSLTP